MESDAPPVDETKELFVHKLGNVRFHTGNSCRNRREECPLISFSSRCMPIALLGLAHSISIPHRASYFKNMCSPSGSPPPLPLNKERAFHPRDWKSGAFRRDIG
jgi:hypothetical protein